jgi:hypothetical protein
MVDNFGGAGGSPAMESPTMLVVAKTNSNNRHSRAVVDFMVNLERNASADEMWIM